MLRTESTTDSPEDVKAAFELIGQPVEITTFEDGLNTPNPEETAPAPEQNGEAETVTPEAAAPEPAPIVATPENEEDFEAALLDDSLPKGVRQRIQKLLAKATKTKYEAEAALAAANKAKPEPEAEPEVPAPEAPKPAAEAKPKPKLEDFADQEDPQEAYLEALTDWKTDQKTAALEAKLREEFQRTNQQATADAEAREWGGAVQSEGLARHPDWETRANDPKTKEIVFSPAFNHALMETGDPGLTADIVYYLTDHPDEAKRIYEQTNHSDKASPNEILRANRIVGAEMARIQGVLTAAAKPVEAPPPAPAPPAPARVAAPPVKVTGAPPPIRPVHGAAPSTAPDPYTNRQMSFKEYNAWRNNRAK